MSKTVENIFTKIVRKIDLFFSFTAKISSIISGVLLVGVTLIIFAGVINRAFFNFAWLFVEEYSALALLPISYLAMGYTLRWNQHLKMDIVVRNVPDLVKNILGIFAATFSLVCLVFMLHASTNWFIYTFIRHVTSSGTLRTPLWIISGTMVLGVLLFTIDMLLLIIHRGVLCCTGKSILRFVEDEREPLQGGGEIQ